MAVEGWSRQKRVPMRILTCHVMMFVMFAIVYIIPLSSHSAIDWRVNDSFRYVETTAYVHHSTT